MKQQKKVVMEKQQSGIVGEVAGFAAKQGAQHVATNMITDVIKER